MALIEDFTPFFADFGEDVVLNGTTTVRGIFDKEYVDALGNLVEGSAPVLRCVAADVPSVEHGDTFEIRSAAYSVASVQPDGTGLVVLVLEAQ